jgi:hypothetical protein
MGFVSEALQLMKMNNFADAAKLMEAHLNDSDLKPSAKVSIMSWISECYAKAEDRQSAGRWSEQAGRAALACQSIPRFEKMKKAREEFEVAMGHYEAVNDVKGMGRMASLKYGMTNLTSSS